MDLLVLLIIAPILFFVGQIIEKKTKIAPPIFYLVIGILFGGSLGVAHIFANEQLLPNTTNYNNLFLWLMFFGAGFNIDIRGLKESGKDTINMSLLPVHIEGIIMAGIVAVGLKVLPIGFDITIPYILIIMLLFAMASPANVIPACMSLNSKGFAGKNKITDTMITASIFDNFTPFPIMLVGLILVMAPTTGINLTPIMLMGITIGIVIAFVIVLVIAAVLGGAVAKMLSPLSNKVAEQPTIKILGITFSLGIIYSLVCFAVFAALISFSGPLQGLGLFIIVAMAVGLKEKEKNDLGKKIGLNASIIFAIFGMPIIFTYVGGSIDLGLLLNPIVLVFGIGVTFIAIIIKGFVTKMVLKDEKYTDGERKFAVACFVAKGVTLINLSLILAPLFIALGQAQVTEFMILLGAISIITSVPLGITLMNNAEGKWIFKEEKND